MNSKINSLSEEHNLSIIPESMIAYTRKSQVGVSIIYHAESKKIIDQPCIAKPSGNKRDNDVAIHKVFVIQKCKTESIGTISLRSSDIDDNSIILGINFHVSLEEQIKTELFISLSELIFKTYAALRIETHILINNHQVINSLLLSGFSFEGVSRKLNSKLELKEFAIFSQLKNHRNPSKAALFPEVNPQIYRDEVIELRLAEPKDTYCMWLEQSNPESHKWGLFDTASPDEIRQKLSRSGLNSAVGPNILLTIVEWSTGNPVGKIVIRNVVPPHVGDVGYGILPEYRGFGYAVRALNLLKKWAFNEAGFVRLELGVKEGNIASEKVAQKGGFEFEGVRPGRLKNHDGSYSNEMHYFFLNPNINYRKIGN